MARSLSFPDSTEAWASGEGWLYDDEEADAEPGEVDLADPAADLDDDLIALHATGAHLLDGLTALEKEVLTARFGLDGRPARSMRDLHHDLGHTRAELREALGDGLRKVREHLR